MTNRHSGGVAVARLGATMTDDTSPVLADTAVDELRQRHPRFLIWYGEATGRYWGMPLWSGASSDLVEARDPAEFSTLAAMIEAAAAAGHVTSAPPVAAPASHVPPDAERPTGETPVLAGVAEPRPVPGAAPA